MKKPLLIIISFCLLVIGFSLLLIFYIFQFSFKNIQFPVKNFEISAGMSFDEIIAKLKNEHLIQSKSVFKIYSVLTGNIGKFKPGRYFLKSNIPIFELVRILVKGPKEISIVIAPGLTLKEIDKKLSEFYIIKPDELINFDITFLEKDYPFLSGAISLEGFLLPDTYRFFTNSTPELVIHKLLENFKTKALPFFENNVSVMNALILASLLEKEIPDYKEKQIIADILLKRIENGMFLQVDATLIYAKCEGEFLNCPLLVKEDYRIDSIYNTYLHFGLPENPICNPDLGAIKAALNPIKSDYWYYLSDFKTKETIFSKTLDEHNKNRVIHLY